ncbi:hypothetical protein [Entomobacter blattae]|uniref:Uncharacterized protein n=1 Tax=Entomobacter blattae TaxID=2762277 RepID=A0A7H1NRR2_9PROT|nr:hypothetical protein [Entomobacter blattae]QNT77552.1 hypothetical protein JGUZn3_02950 [Entomobacter blattae]QNT78472.1 hypothetical protein JGUZn3_12460 [Entomobacter blattae]
MTDIRYLDGNSGELVIRSGGTSFEEYDGTAGNRVSLDFRVSSAPNVTVSGLGSDSFIMAANNGNYNVTGLSIDNRIPVFVDNSVQNAIFTLQDALLVMNGEGGRANATVYDRGNSQIWAGSGTINHTLQSTATGSQLFAGKETGTFNLSGSGQAPVDVILNAVKSESDNYTVNVNNSAGATLFASTGQFSFTGRNTDLVLNDNSVQQGASSQLNLLGDDTLWSGSGIVSALLSGKNNTIAVSGSGAISLTGNGASDGTVSIFTASDAGTGKVSYVQGIEQASIDLKNAFDITLGTGNAVISDFIGSSSLQSLHLAEGQSVTGVTHANGNSVFSLSTGNTVTFLNNATVDQNIFAVA